MYNDNYNVQENFVATVKGIKTVSMTNEEWVDVNTITGISVGTAMSIQNGSSAWVLLAESNDKPTDETPTKTLTDLTFSSANAIILKDSLKVWAKSSSSSLSGKISVQEV